MKTYYRSIEELDSPRSAVEADDGRDEVGRRDFLKLAGFSAAALAATSCQRPSPAKAVPYLTPPEGIVPGRPYQIASTCHGCSARCGILVTCRDGRPTKIEGNPDHPLSRGGVCAVGQATVLGLYDSLRLGAPLLNGQSATWQAADAFIAEKLSAARSVRVVTSTIPSPVTDRAIDAFLERFEDGRRVIYDVPSCSAIAEAHGQTHGLAVVPHFDFERADVIVSIDADFLGTWISPVEFTWQWSSRRTASGERPMSWHAQLEPRMSLTGSKADLRRRIDPRDTTVVLAHLASALVRPRRDLPPLPVDPVAFERIVEQVAGARGRALVVCGSNCLDDQLLVNEINASLGSYGSTLDLGAPSRQRQGSDEELARFLAGVATVDAVFFLGCNPVYDLPSGDALGRQLARTPLVVTFASHPDETSRHAHVVCPVPHPLESWDDSEPVRGIYAVTQPAIAPLRDTRPAIESFAIWSGAPAKAYDLVRAGFPGDWDKTLHDGWVRMPGSADAGSEVRALKVPNPEERRQVAHLGRSADSRNGFALVLYPSISMLDGRHAHNAWLHELPDPITKTTWDNCALLAPAAAAKLGVVDGDVVRVGDVDLPALVQPGQHESVVAVALGYGRMGTDRFTNIGPKWILARTFVEDGGTIGKRVVHLATLGSVDVVKTGVRAEIATTQLHSSMEGRAPVQEVLLSGAGGQEHGHHAEGNGLWPVKTSGGQQWALAIDLTRCTGCSACVIACQAENNVPVVGRDEVVRQREMHWIRIDRYYSGKDDEVEVVHQPMMCAHCGNAPCETVCPVLATVHSSDGLNQQVYNRCVGTRYCANNCPYKTRRFNWFDYPHEDRFANLVLNPDVVVRSRGVMEKCSMCAQRIEQGRIEAKLRGTPVADGAIRMACEQTCPAGAIVFGNAADPKSRIAAARRDPHHYRVLEELNVQPAVGYQKLVRNA